MPRSVLFVACCLSVLVIVAVTSAQEPAPAQAPAEQAHDEKADLAMLNMVCGVCHDATLVAGPFRAPVEWDELFDRMQSYGATVTDEQKAQLRSYLLRTYGKANVNTAPAKDLAPVLDITATVADAVVTYRQQNGPFKTLDDLKKVPALDAAKVDARKARLTF